MRIRSFRVSTKFSNQPAFGQSLNGNRGLPTGGFRLTDSVGPSHNYYMGRESADLSRWIEYFCLGMADAFSAVRAKAMEEAKKQNPDQAKTLKKLDARQRQALMLFESEPYITTKQIADHLGIHRRTALNLCKGWVDGGFLLQLGEAKKSRKYKLADEG